MSFDGYLANRAINREIGSRKRFPPSSPTPVPLPPTPSPHFASKLLDDTISNTPKNASYFSFVRGAKIMDEKKELFHCISCICTLQKFKICQKDAYTF